MELVFFVNGKKISEKNPDPRHTLLHYLRYVLYLPGSKEGCGTGGCGACTVMMSSVNRNTNKVHHRAVLSCLTPLCSVHGAAVTTVEGLGSTSTTLHPVQERLVAGFGSQCGFCSPGMVMSMYSLLRNYSKPSDVQIQAAIQGNLCRCTGYRPIMQAFQTFSEEFECNQGENCCRVKKQEGAEKVEPRWGTPCCYDQYEPSQEPIFPPELMTSNKFDAHTASFTSGSFEWHRPSSITELLKLRTSSPGSKIVAGNTTQGLSLRKSPDSLCPVIAIGHMQPLQQIEITDRGLQVGAAVTIATLHEELIRQLDTIDETRGRIFKGIVNSLSKFGGQQIRNMATVGGCIAGGWSPSDLNTSLMTLACYALTLNNKGEAQEHKLTSHLLNNFPDEIVTGLIIPFSSKDQHFSTFKQSRRKEFDSAQVNAAMLVTFKPGGSNIISSIRLGFSGAGFKMILAEKTMEHLAGKSWSPSTCSSAIEQLSSELQALPDSPWCTSQYAQALAAGFLLKFFVEVAQLNEISLSVEDVSPSPRIFEGLQVLTEAPNGEDCLHRPVQNESAYLHATGQAVYTDDVPVCQNELYLGLVLSDKALADIVSIDWDDALSTPGAVDKVDHTDIPGSNMAGALFPEEEIFSSKKVLSEGQVIGGVLATSKMAARIAANKVKVKYETQQKPVITLKEAIDKKQYLGEPRTLDFGDLDAGFKHADGVMEGTMTTGGQDHFCMESMSCVANPTEKGGVEVYVSTQTMIGVQSWLSSVLDVPMHKVKCHARRVGGSFGSKDFRPIYMAAPVAVAATKVHKPVRCMLTREENMKMMGGRDGCHIVYKVGYTKEGRITALDVTLNANVGYSIDISQIMLQCEIVNFTTIYNVPNLKIHAVMCQTNTRSSTSFRGFGKMPSMLTMEEIVSKIADKVNLPKCQVQEVNFYKEGDTPPMNWFTENWTLPTCWQKVLQQSQYQQVIKDKDQFNRIHKLRKRGSAVVPCTMHVGVAPGFLNTGSALVNIFKDGSVLLSFSGVELGQGLHTKMIQLASHVLKIPKSLIMTDEANTNVVPNPSPSIGGQTSDYNGFAIKMACETLLSRLEPLKTNMPNGEWKDWVQAAYFSSINLSAVGYYRGDAGYDWASKTGRFGNYLVYGAAVSIVEIDTVTGGHNLIKTDIVMDVGQSINPAIDLGQIEGAFVMGYGWLTMEDIQYSEDGNLLSKDPFTYKVPTVGCIPDKFNVTLITGSGEPRAVYSSKSMGEAPMFLSGSVFFAIKDAISAARTEAGMEQDFLLTQPATGEKIRLLCGPTLPKL